MSNIHNGINVFEYADYRRFLGDYYRDRKAKDPRFSHRFIAGQVRAGSSGWYSDIVKGRGNLSGGHLVSLLKVLRLAPAEAEYFEVLVRFDQASSMDEKNLFYKRLLSLKGVKPELVGMDKFEFYSEWYHSIIRELLFFYPFRGDFVALGKKLIPSIGASEARKSILLLERLGFIRKEAFGSYKAASAALKKDSAFKSLHLSNFFKVNASLGMESLDRFPKEERDVSAMALSLSPAGFRRLKDEIRALQERMLAMMESDDNPDRVYQCNFHVFPVTK